MFLTKHGLFNTRLELSTPADTPIQMFSKLSVLNTPTNPEECHQLFQLWAQIAMFNSPGTHQVMTVVNLSPTIVSRSKLLEVNINLFLNAVQSQSEMML
jgi:hypothetical protein